jgi:hypothetical protein
MQQEPTTEQPLDKIKQTIIEVAEQAFNDPVMGMKVTEMTLYLLVKILEKLEAIETKVGDIEWDLGRSDPRDL